MSAVARKWAGHQKIADQTILAVLRALAWGADKGTGNCRKSQADLAREAGVTDRAVRAALTVLERLEIVARQARSKGKYGRTTDLIILSLDRNFDVSRAAIRAMRKSQKSSLQPERGSGKRKVCNRNEVPLQPERGSGEYNPVYPEGPIHEEGISRRVVSYSEGEGQVGDAEFVDGPFTANVLPFAAGGRG